MGLMRTRIYKIVRALIILGVITLVATTIFEAIKHPPELQLGDWREHHLGMGMREGVAVESMGPNPVFANADSIEQGRSFYVEFCEACHGRGGRGDGEQGVVLNPPPTDLTRLAEELSDGVIAARVMNGGIGMPPFQKAVEENGIWHLTNYIKTLR